MKFVTLGFKEDGSTVLLAGSEVPPAEQRQRVDAYRREGLPEGIAKVEIWARNKTKVAVRPTVAVEPAEEPAGEGPTELPQDSKPAKQPKAPKAAKPEADPFA